MLDPPSERPTLFRIDIEQMRTSGCSRRKPLLSASTKTELSETPKRHHVTPRRLPSLETRRATPTSSASAKTSTDRSDNVSSAERWRPFGRYGVVFRGAADAYRTNKGTVCLTDSLRRARKARTTAISWDMYLPPRSLYCRNPSCRKD